MSDPEVLSIEQRVAALASQDPAKINSDLYNYPEISHIPAWLNNFNSLAPQLVVVVETVFRNLGVDTPYKPGDDLRSYLTNMLPDFNDYEIDADQTGSKILEAVISPTAPVRVAFSNMQSAFENAHGSKYQVELTTAKTFGFWAIARSARQV